MNYYYISFTITNISRQGETTIHTNKYEKLVQADSFDNATDKIKKLYPEAMNFKDLTIR